jgi:hypothetical protein
VEELLTAVKRRYGSSGEEAQGATAHGQCVHLCDGCERGVCVRQPGDGCVEACIIIGRRRGSPLTLC